MLSRLAAKEPEISEDEYTQGLGMMSEKGSDLAELVGYLKHMHNQARRVWFMRYRNWSYRKIFGAIHGDELITYQTVGGVVLANIADFFDELVRLKYAQTYDPVDFYRGKRLEKMWQRAHFTKFLNHTWAVQSHVAAKTTGQATRFICYDWIKDRDITIIL